MNILGSDGKPMDLKRAVRKFAAEAWMEQAMAGDKALGRSSANFAAPPHEELARFLPALKAKGITVYVGSGQVVLADLKPEAPVLIQRRPLAQRRIILEIKS